MARSMAVPEPVDPNWPWIIHEFVAFNDQRDARSMSVTVDGAYIVGPVVVQPGEQVRFATLLLFEPGQKMVGHGRWLFRCNDGLSWATEYEVEENCIPVGRF
jgi:hypothetical protein